MVKKLSALCMALSLTAVMVSTAGARVFDPSVVIQRAQNSPIITVKIEEARARVVELRINGRSVSSRSLRGTDKLQEVQFHVDLSSLDEGDNAVEVRTYAEDGSLLTIEKDSIRIESTENSPVQVSSPKQGASLQGLIEVRMDLKARFTRPYVSFMIDGDWKAVRNTEPYTYIWDTESVANGWHEIQVWVVGDDNVTLRSKRVRVFVDNPGGRTDRITTPIVNMVPTAPVPPLAPLTSLSGSIVGRVGSRSGVKATPLNVAPIVMGTRTLTPTGSRVVAPAKQAKPAVKPPVKPTPTLPKVAPVPSTVRTIAITKGMKLNETGPIKLSYNGKSMQFDVAPHVVEGVPVTPFRHLIEQAGGKVKWSHESKSVDATGLGADIHLQANSDIALIGGQELKMDYQAFIRKSRILVPLSFISSALSVTVDYDPATKHVFIRKAQ